MLTKCSGYVRNMLKMPVLEGVYKFLPSVFPHILCGNNTFQTKYSKILM